MKQHIIFCCLLLLSITLPGCWDQKIIDKMSFVTELGLESTPNHELLFTFVAPHLYRQNGNRDVLYSVRENSVQSGIWKGSLFANGNLEAGLLQHLLVAEELAGQGVHRLLEGFEREPLKPMQTRLIVVEGSPNALLKEIVTSKVQPRADLYLEQVLKRAATQSFLSETSLGEYEVACASPGSDPLLPMVKPVPSGIVVTGTALFAKDKMVGKLDPEQTVLLLAMMNRLRRTKLFLKSVHWVEKGEVSKKGIALAITKARRKLSLKMNDQQLELKLNLRLKVNLLEYRWDRLDDKKEQTKLEQRLADELRTACLRVLRYTQQVGSDPLGCGAKVRVKYNAKWPKLNWRPAYRDARLNVAVSVEIGHYGLIN
jgi:Ger(x)C family germination protein